MYREYFIKYLQEIRGCSESTVKHYLNALNVISKYLVELGKIQGNIYEVSEVDELVIIKEFLFHDVEFINKDSKGHQMYSSGLNNYCRFAIGEGLNGLEKKSEIFDDVIQKGQLIERTTKRWNRSSIMKWQSIQMANFKCEINPKHITFIARASDMPYMEGHHIMPMSLQVEYKCSIDVHSNIMCLCPICHRLLHYGKNDERVELLKHIYDKRYPRMINCGIEINEKDFVDSIIES